MPHVAQGAASNFDMLGPAVPNEPWLHFLKPTYFLAIFILTVDNKG